MGENHQSHSKNDNGHQDSKDDLHRNALHRTEGKKGTDRAPKRKRVTNLSMTGRAVILGASISLSAVDAMDEQVGPARLTIVLGAEVLCMTLCASDRIR